MILLIDVLYLIYFAIITIFIIYIKVLIQKKILVYLNKSYIM